MLHTHPRPEPGQPWKARGRKKRTQTTGNRPKQRRGGEGTNGPPEPTYAEKRTWQKQSTHLTPRHITERHEGRIRDQIGGLVNDERKKPKQLTKKGPSSNDNRSRALLPFGTVVKSWGNGINGCSSSSELGAQNVQPHQKPSKRMDLPGFCVMLQFICPFKSCVDEKEVSGCSDLLPADRDAFLKVSRGTAGTAGLRKRLVIKRPTVSLYVNELPD